MFVKILKVQNLCKKYKDFTLDNVSFSLEQGYIMGFIGVNGAGKTTTIKGIMNFISRDGGRVELFGREFDKDEIALKQDIALMMGGSQYYQRRKIKTITAAVQPFYSNWDEQAYQHYLKRFDLNPEKKIGELSQGMTIKYSLTLALSHQARLLILDEPTSGLDPAARDDLLELFQELVESGEKSILFSTHITSDLEKCADYITFIDRGKIVRTATRDDFIDAYRLISGASEELNKLRKDLISWKIHSFGYQALMENEKWDAAKHPETEIPSLEDIMIFFSKRELLNEKTA